ncbi:MAG: hypothetical protein K1X82_05825 [Bacteroidia bacterium]|nr:hypothetical protein [Bacteroidia bacterium]
MKKLLMIGLALINCYGALGQTLKSFQHDQAAFLKEMNDFMVQTDKKKTEEFMEKFAPIWNGSSFSATQREAIYNTSDLMLKKRLKAYPHFQNYLFTLMSFVESKQNETSFAAWQSSLDKLLGRSSTKKFVAYLEVCNYLFSKNILYKSVSTEWASDNSNYSFGFDSVPYIRFPKLTLVCRAKSDSSVVYNTSGDYYPTEETFRGNGGRVNWKRAGLPESQCFADLKRYSVDIGGSKFVADSVIFTNYEAFSKPLIGRYEDKLLANVDSASATYPRFESYLRDLEIKDFFKNIDYRGGFAQHGARFLGYGNKLVDATVTIKRLNDSTKKIEPFLVARSKAFLLKKDRITSQKAAISVYWKKDSIFHPGLEFKFINTDREAALLRGEEGMSKAPFLDSWHHCDLYIDAIYWKIDDPRMDFKMLSGGDQARAIFESQNYYDEVRYTKIQGMDDVHPFSKLKKCAESYGSKKIPLAQAASCLKISESAAKSFLLKLTVLGFCAYDLDKDEVTVKDKATDYLQNRVGTKDYDVIQFISQIEKGGNATLSLLNFDLQTRGVAEIFLSDSQNVYIAPKNQEIVIKKDRNFTFDGKVQAGRFTFFGKEYDFNYNFFKINLNAVDSLRIKVPSKEKDEFGRPLKLIAVKSLIQDIRGELFIDQPANKSGLKNFPQYPIFKSLKDSYVYYDNKNIQKGAYKKENFYFRNKPFEIDSLDNFTAEGLAFKGEFSSAGIFNDFDETLTLQDDYSLGFKKKTPPGGMDLYGGKGKFTNEIQMSNEGLKGSGEIKYLNSVTTSKEILFYPDSTNTTAETYTMTQSAGPPEYPQGNAEGAFVHWLPKKDVMEVSSREKPISLFNGISTMKGKVSLSPKGLSGNGLMDFDLAEMDSKNFKYKQNSFSADTSNFRLTDPNTKAPSFTTTNLKSNIDFNKRVGEFKSNAGATSVQFPVNKYICMIDEFKWFMDKGTIDFISKNKVSGGDGDLVGSKFVSIAHGQDSLYFVSPKATFDQKAFTITAFDVKYIESADAQIFPDSGKVVVKENADMQELNNAKIIANRTTKFHKLYECNLKITGRKRYSGSGKYDYVDVAGQKKSIALDKISVDSAFQTYGEGSVLEETGFTLSPYFAYKGKAQLYASKEFLTFNGSTKIIQNCEGIGSSWLRFESEINPKEILIPIEKEPKDANGNKISTGIVLTKDSTHVYPTFLSKKVSYSDIDVIAADGYLYYDNTSKEFRISNKEKLKGAVVPGNFISLNDKCVVNGQGKMNFGVDLGQVEIQPVGVINHIMEADTTVFNGFVGMNFFFNEEAMRIMAEKLYNHFPPLEAVTYGNEYEKALMELAGKEKATKYMQELNLYGTYKKTPEELNQTLFLSDLKLAWSTKNSSYRYKGFIGVSSVIGFQVNKQCYGAIEYVKKRGGDSWSLYLEPSEGQWYFFTYRNGLMSAISSNQEFNSAIRETKLEKRDHAGKVHYQYNLSTELKKRDFLRSFETK